MFVCVQAAIAQSVQASMEWHNAVQRSFVIHTVVIRCHRLRLSIARRCVSSTLHSMLARHSTRWENARHENIRICRSHTFILSKYFGATRSHISGNNMCAIPNSIRLRRDLLTCISSRQCDVNVYECLLAIINLNSRDDNNNAFNRMAFTYTRDQNKYEWNEQRRREEREAHWWQPTRKGTKTSWCRRIHSFAVVVYGRSHASSGGSAHFRLCCTVIGGHCRWYIAATTANSQTRKRPT